MWYPMGMMKVGDMVKLSAKFDTFHGAKGIIIKRVENTVYVSGFYFQVQLFSGEVIIGLPAELELLENDVEIPS